MNFSWYGMKAFSPPYGDGIMENGTEMDYSEFSPPYGDGIWQS